MARRRYRIDEDNHEGETGACVMEWVALIEGKAIRKTDTGFRVSWLSDAKTDMPTCTHPMVRNVAVCINDEVVQTDRDKLAVMIPRLLRAGSRGTATQRGRVSRRLLLWTVRRYLDQIELNRAKVEEALRLWDEWLRDGEDIPERAYAEHVRAMVEPSDAPDNVLSLLRGHVAYGVESLMAYFTGHDPEKMLEFLSDLMTQLEKAHAEEGLMLDDDGPVGNPDDGYLSEDELAELIRELGGEQP